MTGDKRGSCLLPCEIRTLADAKAVTADAKTRFYSAEHHEIRRGLTTDIYFVRTREILDKLGLGKTSVVAEIFSRKSGVLAGVGEVLHLLEDKQVKIWAVPEGEEFRLKRSGNAN